MDPKLLIAAVAAVFALDLGWQFYQNTKRNELLKRLDTYLGKKDYAAFDELIESDMVRKAFPLYNINFMKLNEAMFKEDMKETDRAFESFDMPMNKAQKEALYKKGFYYYLGIENKEKTDHYYDLLKQLEVRDQKSLDLMYDIYINKGYAYLEETLEKIQNMPEDQKMPFYALISDMYRNKGDTKEAEKYEKIVSEYTEKLKT